VRIWVDIDLVLGELHLRVRLLFECFPNHPLKPKCAAYKLERCLIRTESMSFALPFEAYFKRHAFKLVCELFAASVHRSTCTCTLEHSKYRL